MIYSSLSTKEREVEYTSVCEAYQTWKSKNLHLNMARGNPSSAQLALSRDILTILAGPEDCIEDGIDARNYGHVSGLPSARKLFADILGCKPSQIFVGGNASLQLMYDTISKAFTHGLLHSEKPWCREEKLKWLCPVPGYDRHFRITQSFGFELISIPCDANGPDMDMVEELIKDPSVKGIWTNPKYSNPEGVIYSDEVIHRLAAMKPAAPDFLLMWDNSYCLHELGSDFVPFEDILSLCEAAGNADMVFEYASTSKITMAGGGISCFACSEANLAYMEKLIGVQTIGFDKMNQLRHVRYLKSKEHVLELMGKHAAIMKPKFDLVLNVLQREVGDLEIADWHEPKGGYFVAVHTKPGLAKRTLELCKEAGITMTAAGATYPYGIDPKDSTIRIAPSFPPLEELEQAMEIFCLCLRMAALEQLNQ